MTFEQAKEEVEDLLDLACRLKDGLAFLKERLPDPETDYDTDEWGDMPEWVDEADTLATKAWGALLAATAVSTETITQDNMVRRLNELWEVCNKAVAGGLPLRDNDHVIHVPVERIFRPVPFVSPGWIRYRLGPPEGWRFHHPMNLPRYFPQRDAK